MDLTKTQRRIILIFGLIALFWPNGLYLHTLIYKPTLNSEAMSNPTAQAFMIEAFMLLGLFLWYVFYKTKSWYKVIIYLSLAFMGSLAFSFPMYLYFETDKS